MSTYGKKALIEWEYYGKNTQLEITRFNNTTHNIQEEILKRWYPIEFTCQKTSKGSTEYYGQYKVINHVKLGYGWRVEVIDEKGYISIVHPGNLMPDKRWNRDQKLKELGI